MSYTYLQDQGAVSLADCFLDINQFAPLNGSKTQETSSFNDSETESCRDSRSGTTCKPLTESLGEDESMSFAEDSLAKILAQQDSEKGYKASDLACGRTWQGSSARFDPDSYSWKTHQLSLIMDWEQSLATFPQWGLMHDGELWELTIQDYHTIAEDAGLLPTVVKSEGEAFLGGPIRSSETWKDTNRLSHRLIGLWKSFAKREMNGRIRQKIACHPTFAEWMMGWPEMWSASSELETDKFQAWLLLHSRFFQGHNPVVNHG